jgi:large subunit ribosomal protein L19
MKLSNLVKKIQSNYLKKNMPNFKVGSNVCVNVLIQEGNKKRIQAYSGQVTYYHRAGLNSTITVRRLSKGIGIERIFPIHCPDIDSIKILEK